MKNLLIIGAGSAGKMVANEILLHKDTSAKYKITGFLDDDKNKNDINGIKILGQISDAKNIIESNKIDEVIIAIPSAKKDVISKIINNLSNTDIKIKIVPGIYEIIEGKVNLNQIRDIDARDLLGREEVGFDNEKLEPFYKDKTVFISGAGGSIGSEILRQLLKLPVKKIIAFGHGETSIYNLQTSLNDARIDYIIGDIKDINKLDNVLQNTKPDIFFHAAAHKHVPLMESFPDEAVKNNIIGTYNCALLSIKNKVKIFTLISTDKAVNPVSVMGATKRIAEKIILSFNNIQKNTKFSLTRFGNVLSSRGSVVPLFEKQIQKGGPVTVTHPDITRFFMSIPEAARLVIKASSVKNGNIFILDMGQPIKIIDLAKNMIRLYGFNEDQITIEFNGLRPGEKMYEELLTKYESLQNTEFNKLLISNELEKLLTGNQLKNMIKRFSKASESLNIKMIKKLFKEFIPEYEDKSIN